MRFTLTLSTVALLCAPLPGLAKPESKDLTSMPEGIYQTSPQRSAGSEFDLMSQGENEDEPEEVPTKVFGSQAKGITVVPPDDFMTNLKPQDVKWKKTPKDDDRRLAVNDKKDFFTDVVTPNKLRNLLEERKPATGGGKSLRGIEQMADKYFMADVAAPLLLQNKLAKATGNRRLQTAQCAVLSDGSLACLQRDFPGENLYTAFFNCPTGASNVLQCETCKIFGTAGEPDPENDPSCNSCQMCTNTVAFNCANIGSGNCVVRDCAGNCSGPGSPTPSPTPPPTPSPTPGGTSSGSGGVSCQKDKNGATFCVLKDYPATNFLTVFLDCPETPTNALQCSRCTVVAPDDTPTEIDLINDEQCSTCTVCSNRASYDCSNLDRGDCSILDCAGNCSGPENTTPTVSPPTASQPSFAPPTEGSTKPPSAAPPTSGFGPLRPPTTSAGTAEDSTPAPAPNPFNPGAGLAASSASGNGALFCVVLALGSMMFALI